MSDFANYEPMVVTSYSLLLALLSKLNAKGILPFSETLEMIDIVQLGLEEMGVMKAGNVQNVHAFLEQTRLLVQGKPPLE